MRAKGIDRICYPIRGEEGLYTFSGGTLIVLFNYIPATQGFNYNPYVFGRLIAKIHAITPGITAEMPEENFECSKRELFDTQFEHALNYKGSDPAMLEFKNLLSVHEKEIKRHRNEFLRLGKLSQKEQRNLVITHGDMPTNVLVKSPDDIYIIDWDELRLAPAERDLWMVDERPEFMAGYKSIRPDFIVSRNRRSFCILQYYFERMIYYFSEILNESTDPGSRIERIKKLAEGRMAGWILPKVDETGLND